MKRTQEGEMVLKGERRGESQGRLEKNLTKEERQTGWARWEIGK